MKNPSLFALYTAFSLCLPLGASYLCGNGAREFFGNLKSGMYLHAAYSVLCSVSFLVYGIFLYNIAIRKATAPRRERASVGYLSFFSLFAGFLSEYFCFCAPVASIFFTVVFALCALTLGKILTVQNRACAAAVLLPLAFCAIKIYCSARILLVLL